MAVGGDFTLIPSEVIELEPVYNNIITPSETMKKEFLNLSSTPLQQYQLKFKALSIANKDIFLAHYQDQLAGVHEFTWKSVPIYIESGVNITGRWVEGSLSFFPVGHQYWRCSVVMEKSV